MVSSLMPRAMTGDIKHVLAFISYFHAQLALPHKTIRLYLADVQHFLYLQDPRKPSLFTAHTVKSILRGIHKASARSQLQLLTHHKCHLQGHVNHPVTFPIWVSIQPGHPGSSTWPSTTFAAFSGPGSKILCRHHLARFQDHFVLHLVISKTQQSSPGVEVNLPDQQRLMSSSDTRPVTVSPTQPVKLQPWLPFLTSPPEWQPVHQAP